jgi:SAM-dependent methyltransferase
LIRKFVNYLMQTLAQTIWFETTLGQQLLAREQAMFDHAVSDVFGFYAVQVGTLPINCLEQSRIPNIILTGMASGNVQCESCYLPFAESSIDLLCMPHVLEFSHDPHQTLREAARVLVPEGYLILTVFNPLSFWGLKKLLIKKSQYPWEGQFFSLSRIKDWLALLGLEFVEAQFLSHEPPINNEKWLKRMSIIERLGRRWWPMMGGQYVIVAKKRVVNITLLKPKWKRSLLQSGLGLGGHNNMNQNKSQQQRGMKEKNNE